MRVVKYELNRPFTKKVDIGVTKIELCKDMATIELVITELTNQQVDNFIQFVFAHNLGE